MSANDKREYGQKIFYVLLVIGFLLAVLCIRHFYIIKNPDEKYAKPREATITYKGNRGEILDRNGRVLAVSKPCKSIQVFCAPRVTKETDPKTGKIKIISELPYVHKEDIDSTSQKLFSLISKYLSPEDIKKYHVSLEEINKNLKLYASEGRSGYLLRKAPDELCSAVTDEQNRIYDELTNELNKGSRSRITKIDKDRPYEDLSGVEIIEDYPLRVYPNGSLACHIIGSENFYGESDKNSGLEADMNADLSPKERKVTMPIDKTGHRVSDNADNERNISKKADDDLKKLDGKNIILTIDERIQHITEEALKQGVIRFKADSGSCVVMDAKTADILAIASYPVFTPGELSENYDPQKCYNRALYDKYEPGSIFKPFIAAIAADCGYTKDSYFASGDRIYVDGEIITNSYKGSPGSEALREIIAYSSNTGISSCLLALEKQLGREKLENSLQAFGFGKEINRPGIRLLGDDKGYVGPRVFSDLRRFELANVSFGQGSLISPIQLASAAQAIANKGRRIEPHLIKAVYNPADGTTEEKIYPVIDTPISEKAAAEITDMMCDVVAYGTGDRAAVDGYEIAGKTGTAQIWDEKKRRYFEKRYNGGFLGIVPAHDPKLVIVVRLEAPVYGEHHGGHCAAPVFKNICSKVLPLLNIAPKEGYHQVRQR